MADEKAMAVVDETNWKRRTMVQSIKTDLHATREHQLIDELAEERTQHIDTREWAHRLRRDWQDAEYKRRQSVKALRDVIAFLEGQHGNHPARRRPKCSGCKRLEELWKVVAAVGVANEDACLD